MSRQDLGTIYYPNGMYRRFGDATADPGKAALVHRMNTAATEYDPAVVLFDKDDAL